MLRIAIIPRIINTNLPLILTRKARNTAAEFAVHGPGAVTGAVVRVLAADVGAGDAGGARWAFRVGRGAAAAGGEVLLEKRVRKREG